MEPLENKTNKFNWKEWIPIAGPVFFRGENSAFDSDNSLVYGTYIAWHSLWVVGAGLGAGMAIGALGDGGGYSPLKVGPIDFPVLVPLLAD